MKPLNPADWPRPSGYSNGIVAEGKTVYIAGMIGWNSKGEFANDFIEQLAQVLENITAVLREAEAGPEHIVRMTWFVKDLEAYRGQLQQVGAVYRRIIGKNFPTMSVVGVNDLVEPKALLEIEVTAVIENS